MMTRLTVFALVWTAGGAACHLVFPYGSSSSPRDDRRDAPAVADASGAETRLDARTADRGSLVRDSPAADQAGRTDLAKLDGKLTKDIAKPADAPRMDVPAKNDGKTDKPVANDKPLVTKDKPFATKDGFPKIPDWPAVTADGCALECPWGWTNCCPPCPANLSQCASPGNECLAVQCDNGT